MGFADVGDGTQVLYAFSCCEALAGSGVKRDPAQCNEVNDIGEGFGVVSLKPGFRRFLMRRGGRWGRKGGRHN